MLNITDLNKLKVFHAVYSLKSLSRAAELLNVTRSAVSQNLKSLEAETKTELFVRNSKEVRPTKSAAVLYNLMEPFLLELGMALKEIEHGRKNPSGHLRIGAPLEFGSNQLTELLARFWSEHPSVTFELFLGVPARQLEKLLQGDLDLAFIDNGDIFLKNYPIGIETIRKEEFALVSSSNFYRQHIKKDHSMTSLQKLPIVDYLSHAPVARMWFKHSFGKTITNLRVVYSAESVHAVINAIAQGMGVGVVPTELIENRKNEFQIISTPRKPMINLITLALPLSKKLTYTERTFVAFLKENLK